MKSSNELSALKEEVEALNAKLHELTDEELFLVAGGTGNASSIFYNIIMDCILRGDALGAKAGFKGFKMSLSTDEMNSVRQEFKKVFGYEIDA